MRGRHTGWVALLLVDFIAYRGWSKTLKTSARGRAAELKVIFIYWDQSIKVKLKSNQITLNSIKLQE